MHDAEELQAQVNQGIAHPDYQVIIVKSAMRGGTPVWYVHGLAFHRDRHRADDPSIAFYDWARLSQAVMRHHRKWTVREAAIVQ